MAENKSAYLNRVPSLSPRLARKLGRDVELTEEEEAELAAVLRATHATVLPNRQQFIDETHADFVIENPYLST